MYEQQLIRVDEAKQYLILVQRPGENCFKKFKEMAVSTHITIARATWGLMPSVRNKLGTW